jgi:NAD(P)-dependent dehydrogenase (short-subunit alcohol dehydrogenase family)
MRILVTGAATGIGRATAIELTKRGHEVVATARRLEALDELDVADRLVLDVTDEGSVAAAIAAAGDLDGIVNNAGLSEPGPIEDYPPDVIRRVLETNVLGPMLVSQAVIAPMRERGGGVIVNVGSVQGRIGIPFGGTYCASKHALEGFSEVLRYEVGHFGIRVVLVEPGYIASGAAYDPARERVSHGEHLAVYDELRRQWDGADDQVAGAVRPGPEVVAAAIADAFEDPATPFRVRIGADAEMVLAARSSMDDETFEATMRAVLDLTW